MKTKRLLSFLFLTFIIYILTFNIAEGTVRYVSKTGSSTPPYTSWETAADSIQKCINISQFGDTIYVANGIYYESIYVNKTINLFGSSTDSTIINSAGTTDLYVIYFFENNSTLRNFKFVAPSVEKSGIQTRRANIQAEDIHITDVYAPLLISTSSVNIKSCIIVNFNTHAIFDQCPADTCNSKYSGNVYVSNSGGTTVDFTFGGTPTFINNIVLEEGNTLRGVDVQYHRGAIVRNNLISGFRQINLRAGEIRTDTVYFENNNSVNSSTGIGIASSTAHRTRIRNNIVKDTYTGINSSNGTVIPNYNLFWNNNTNISGTAVFGGSNIIANPMFVCDTLPALNGTYDLHLQKYSPAIDAGDPTILDVDGTRSDIGMYGGSGGEKYEYLDLAPGTPKNFTYTFDTTSNFLTLNWNMNTEYDFRYYNIYRDTVSGFTPGASNLIAQTDTSYFSDNLSNIKSGSVYYRVTAVDSQENESQPGNEIAVTITTGLEHGVEIIRDYILYQNYPNPFNPTTRIGYEIKERAYVKLMVYDIKGELVSVLVNKEQTAGYYEVEFSTTGHSSASGGLSGISDLAAGIYLYRIEVIGEGRIPVYSDMKKMLLLK